MLTELHIENLGVIERTDLVLGPGLTAITGETGAGKTMLVEALDLVVGGRAESIVVRHGAAEARVDARFVCGDHEVVLSRVVPAEGRSRAYVDGRPATVAALADAAADLVDLHGQHAHQRLLSPASQREALDAFGGVDLAPLRAARARVTEIEAELATLGGDERTRSRQLDVARYQLAELDAADISDPDEDTTLEAAEDTLAGAVEHKETGAIAHEALTGDGGGRDALAAAAAAIAGRAPYREYADRLADVLAELDDLAAGIRDTAESIDEDPERLEAVRQRRQLLHDMQRKYGDDLAEVMQYHREVAERVDELERFDERAEALDTARREALAEVGAAARAVRAQRQAAAPELGTAITERLADLAMPNAVVEVTVADSGAGDDVTFLLAANPGTPPLPFTKIASGGELARTMLALRLVMIGHELPAQPGSGVVATLVFDEVDAGIGGGAATAVGRALAEVGAAFQVLVVTHLPQVAAAADTQISVEKRVADGATTTSATVIDGRRRVSEIARMLSGDEGGAAAERHARQLLAR
ncbi:DNA repair protein RecN [Desertimonas flava]|uniref:DNA repair protein RecN n=1 Tax=Desertimonas flava TaxID=2064846 RepID=UPI000E344D4F|nr:DNA repair protein RecN [Desertimonas flava]